MKKHKKHETAKGKVVVLRDKKGKVKHAKLYEREMLIEAPEEEVITEKIPSKLTKEEKGKLHKPKKEKKPKKKKSK